MHYKINNKFVLLTIILNWRLRCSSRPQQLFVDPWPFSDSHSTPLLFIDPSDGSIDPWGSISTTFRITVLVSFWVNPGTTAWEKGLVKCHTSASQVLNFPTY